MDRRFQIVLLTLATVAASGCGTFIANQAAASTYRILQKSSDAAQRQPDLQLAREAMPSGILQLEAFALAYPEFPGFKVMYAETVCQYADGFVFDDWEDASLGDRPDEADRLASRLGTLLGMCVDANLALLPPAWRSARQEGGDAWTRAVAGATHAQAPALLWIATTDTVALALDPMRQIARVGAITETLTRAMELAPGAHDAGAELLLGTLTAARSRIFGGSDGNDLFTRARRLAGDGALIVDVMFARGVAVARQDRALFEVTLHRVLDADVTRWPDRRLANELARRKARRYLAASHKLLP